MSDFSQCSISFPADGGYPLDATTNRDLLPILQNDFQHEKPSHIDVTATTIDHTISRVTIPVPADQGTLFSKLHKEIRPYRERLKTITKASGSCSHCNSGNSLKEGDHIYIRGEEGTSFNSPVLHTSVTTRRSIPAIHSEKTDVSDQKVSENTQELIRNDEEIVRIVTVPSPMSSFLITELQNEIPSYKETFKTAVQTSGCCLSCNSSDRFKEEDKSSIRGAEAISFIIHLMLPSLSSRRTIPYIHSEKTQVTGKHIAENTSVLGMSMIRNGEEIVRMATVYRSPMSLFLITKLQNEKTSHKETLKKITKTSGGYLNCNGSLKEYDQSFIRAEEEPSFDEHLIRTKLNSRRSVPYIHSEKFRMMDKSVAESISVLDMSVISSMATALSPNFQVLIRITEKTEHAVDGSRHSLAFSLMIDYSKATLRKYDIKKVSHIHSMVEAAVCIRQTVRTEQVEYSAQEYYITSQILNSLNSSWYTVVNISGPERNQRTVTYYNMFLFQPSIENKGNISNQNFKSGLAKTHANDIFAVSKIRESIVPVITGHHEIIPRKNEFTSKDPVPIVSLPLSNSQSLQRSFERSEKWYSYTTKTIPLIRSSIQESTQIMTMRSLVTYKKVNLAGKMLALSTKISIFSSLLLGNDSKDEKEAVVVINKHFEVGNRHRCQLFSSFTENNVGTVKTSERTDPSEVTVSIDIKDQINHFSDSNVTIQGRQIVPNVEANSSSLSRVENYPSHLSVSSHIINSSVKSYKRSFPNLIRRIHTESEKHNFSMVSNNSISKYSNGLNVFEVISSKSDSSEVSIAQSRLVITEVGSTFDRDISIHLKAYLTSNYLCTSTA